VLQGGSDVITFDGIAPGTYRFELTLSGSFIHLAALDIDGTAGTVESNGRFLFADVVGSGSTPFVLTLVGSALGAQANYSGQLAVSAVDEPHEAALLLAGLLMAGVAVARRRR
jgi:MYXO-CTERM domain-containing protein